MIPHFCFIFPVFFYFISQTKTSHFFFLDCT
eukprot:UN03918